MSEDIAHVTPAMAVADWLPVLEANVERRGMIRVGWAVSQPVPLPGGCDTLTTTRTAAKLAYHSRNHVRLGFNRCERHGTAHRTAIANAVVTFGTLAIVKLLDARRRLPPRYPAGVVV